MAWDSVRQFSRFLPPPSALAVIIPPRRESRWGTGDLTGLSPRWGEGPRQDFTAFFGADLVVIPGDEVQGRVDDFVHWRMHELRDAQGRLAVERAQDEYPDTSSGPLCRVSYR